MNSVPASGTWHTSRTFILARVCSHKDVLCMLGHHRWSATGWQFWLVAVGASGLARNSGEDVLSGPGNDALQPAHRSRIC